MKVSDLIESISKKLNSQQEAWWLLEKLTNKNKTQLITQSDINLSEKEQTLLEKWAEQRLNHKPLQYILGSIPFCDLEIITEPPILIPRPETEEWCNYLIEKLHDKKLNILDLCTGSGCIALALGNKLDATITGIDINPQAINLANKNKKHNKINNVNFLVSDLYKAIGKLKFDLIVSNPPYVSESEWETLEPQVKDWESKIALVADDNGMALYEKIIKQANNFLNPNGMIALEIDGNKANKVKKILENYLFSNIEIHQDLFGKNRMLLACKPS